MSQSNMNQSHEPLINAPGETRDIIVRYDRESGEIDYSIIDRPEVAFDHQDIVDQLNCLNMGCSFSVSELKSWTEKAESLEEALEFVTNMVAVNFCVRDGYMLIYVDEAGKTRYAVTAEGARRVGGIQLGS